ncbi:MAG: hypothetical protein ACXVHL_36850 [Solirubrobacteraceae bacterium]
MEPDAIHEQQVPITVNGAAASAAPAPPATAERQIGRYSAAELRTLRELNALRTELDRRMRENLARIKAAAQIAPWIVGEEGRRRLAAQLGRS